MIKEFYNRRIKVDTKDYIDKITINNENINSLCEILENSFEKLDYNTINNHNRKIILKSLNQFYVILKSLKLENLEILKICKKIWHIS